VKIYAFVLKHFFQRLPAHFTLQRNKNFRVLKTSHKNEHLTNQNVVLGGARDMRSHVCKAFEIEFQSNQGTTGKATISLSTKLKCLFLSQLLLHRNIKFRKKKTVFSCVAIQVAASETNSNNNFYPILVCGIISFFLASLFFLSRKIQATKMLFIIIVLCVRCLADEHTFPKTSERD
jgi:hypothetical protein